MKWFTHQTVAIGTGISLNFSPEVIGTMAFGAILPDVIDMKIAGKGPAKQKIFYKIHRGFSHWFGWYFIILLFTLLYPIPNQYRLLLMGCALGALTHIVLDMLTPSGIPLTPSIIASKKKDKRLSFNLCSTGSLKEYIFLLLTISLFWAISGEKMLNTLEKVLNNFFKYLPFG